MDYDGYSLGIDLGVIHYYNHVGTGSTFIHYYHACFKLWILVLTLYACEFRWRANVCLTAFVVIVMSGLLVMGLTNGHFNSFVFYRCRTALQITDVTLKAAIKRAYCFTVWTAP